MDYQLYSSAQNASKKKSAYSKIALVILYIIVIALLLALVGACIAFAVEMSSVKSETASSQTASSLQGSQNTLVRRIENVENLMQQFQEKILELETQSNGSSAAYLELNNTVQEVNVQLTQGLSAIDSKIQPLNVSINNITSFFEYGLLAAAPATSCNALPHFFSSGYYWVRASDGSAVRMYCDMTRSCGGVTGGWARVVYLDMTEDSHQCPSGLRQRTDSNIRTCEIASGTCSSVNFDLQLLEYFRVCGKIRGYQVDLRSLVYHSS